MILARGGVKANHLNWVDPNTGLPRKPVDEDMFMTIRWKVEGKSTEALFTVKINNKDVSFVGLKNMTQAGCLFGVSKEKAYLKGIRERLMI